MKQTILSILIMLLPMMSSAVTIEIDGINYNLITNGNIAEVKSKSSGHYSGDVVIPSVVTYNKVDYEVTSIAQSAFSYCSSLTSISLPNSLTTIGTSAFIDCTSLKSVIIPNSVTEIGGLAFSGCKGLTSVDLGSGVTSIGKSAFNS